MEVICGQCNNPRYIGHLDARAQQQMLQKKLCSSCRAKNLLRRITGNKTENAIAVGDAAPEGAVLDPTVKADASEGILNDSLEKTLKDLENMVGMKRVKESVYDLIGFLEIMKAREKHNIKNEPTTLHVVFRGPPGTGKTTVARILGRVYKHLGYLKKGTMEETDRSGLVAGYVGQTAIQTNKIIDKALHGVLFIDEAYALSPPGVTNDFGSEALATLVKRMEDQRDILAVIIAGYSGDMERFLNANAGLKSRFNTFFDFDHYDPEELIQIFEGLCKKMSYNMTGSTKVEVGKLLTRLYDEMDPRTFGNGRLVRNIMEMAVRKHAARVHKIKERNKGILMDLLPEDLPTPDQINLTLSKEEEEKKEREKKVKFVKPDSPNKPTEDNDSSADEPL